MWIFKYLACLRHDHNRINVIVEGALYRYCLRCGKVEAQNAVTVPIIAGGGRP